MTSLSLLAILLTLAAVFGVLNYRTLRLPNTIGVLVISLAVSLVMLAVDPFIPAYDLRALLSSLLGTVDLPQSLLDGALSFLLFAGAVQVDLGQLLQRKLVVLTLAVLGTLVSVGLLGGGMWLVFPRLGLVMPFAWCLVLGAILAPTDPVSVVGMLRRVGLPAPLAAVFAGESLFNDGVGVVAFRAALGLATGGAATGGASLGSGAGLIGHSVVSAVGGGVLGLVLRWVAVFLLRAADDNHLELLVSLALATGAFSLANALGLSGPIAVVVAGVTLGSRRSQEAISSRGELLNFWSLVDEVLNALLFLLIGLEVVVVPFHWSEVLATLVAIPLSIAARGLSVSVCMITAQVQRRVVARTLAMLTWGGLRGGISVALVLGLPSSEQRPTLLVVCYGVVLFTIIVQGLTIERVARRLYSPGAQPAASLAPAPSPFGRGSG